MRLLLHNALRVDEASAADVTGLAEDSGRLASRYTWTATQQGSSGNPGLSPGPDDAGDTRGLTETDQGRSIVSGPVIMGGAFRSFAAARSRRSWPATWPVMSV